MDYTTHYQSPLGGITLASDGNALIGLWFDGQRHFAKTISEHEECNNLQVFYETRRWLDIYFSHRIPDFTPTLFFRTTPFRRQVWEILLTIPYGHTTTYGDIALTLANRSGFGLTSPRAVGGAVGHNCISLIIPCHRVIGANGSLTGYAGGTDRKMRLLEMENALTR